MAAICGRTTPPGRERGQFEILAQQLSAEQGQENGEARIFDDAAAQGVCESDVAFAYRL